MNQAKPLPGTYGSLEGKAAVGSGRLAVMFNEDGSVVMEVFDKHRRIGLRILPEDVKAHALGLQALERNLSTIGDWK